MDANNENNRQDKPLEAEAERQTAQVEAQADEAERQITEIED